MKRFTFLGVTFLHTVTQQQEFSVYCLVQLVHFQFFSQQAVHLKPGQTPHAFHQESHTWHR